MTVIGDYARNSATVNRNALDDTARWIRVATAMVGAGSAYRKGETMRLVEALARHDHERWMEQVAEGGGVSRECLCSWDELNERHDDCADGECVCREVALKQAAASITFIERVASVALPENITSL